MTEDEAKTKWCPWARLGLNQDVAVNRLIDAVAGGEDGVYDNTRCIGSGCMAWRMSAGKGWCGMAGFSP
jgi:hypothetical protein